MGMDMAMHGHVHGHGHGRQHEHERGQKHLHGQGRGWCNHGTWTWAWTWPWTWKTGVDDNFRTCYKTRVKVAQSCLDIHNYRSYMGLSGRSHYFSQSAVDTFFVTPAIRELEA